LTPGKYWKIISKNKNYTHQLVHSYSKKNVKFLYLRKDEHLKLLDTSIKHLITFYKSKSIDKSKLFIVHLKTIFFIQEFVRHLSVTEEIIELVKLLTESISNLVRSQKTIFNLLAEFDQLSQIGFAEAALLTAYLCEGILAEMEWNADMTKGRLILCAIFQDIHLGNDELIKVRTLDDPILRKFSEEDQQHFREHPKAAGEIAKLFSGYTEVDFILKEHHEHPLGEGFPNGINTSGLTTISSIFIIATHFASKIARSNEGMLAQVETIKFLKRNYVLGNFKEPMKALSKILNVQ
jgi:response regulator RpfG family c-di-GMP phosphodiesterase